MNIFCEYKISRVVVHDSHAARHTRGNLCSESNYLIMCQFDDMNSRRNAYTCRSNEDVNLLISCLFPAYQSRANLYNVNCTRLFYSIMIFHMIFTRIAIIKNKDSHIFII